MRVKLNQDTETVHCHCSPSANQPVVMSQRASGLFFHQPSLFLKFSSKEFGKDKLKIKSRLHHIIYRVDAANIEAQFAILRFFFPKLIV